ncbi:MAG: SecDF P1 head subdomain-containing protein [Planctomycetota bacterium]|jgi:SecD/SecF fusion protein
MSRSPLIVLAILSLACGSRKPKRSHVAVSVQFRLVDEGKSEDSIQMELGVGKQEKELLHLAREVVLDHRDIASAESPLGDDLNAHLTIHLTPEGAEKFKEITAANINRRLALIVDSRVIAAPVIREKIEGSVRVSLPVPPSEGLALAAKITGAASLDR